MSGLLIPFILVQLEKKHFLLNRYRFRTLIDNVCAVDANSMPGDNTVFLSSDMYISCDENIIVLLFHIKF